MHTFKSYKFYDSRKPNVGKNSGKIHVFSMQMEKTGKT